MNGSFAAVVVAEIVVVNGEGGRLGRMVSGDVFLVIGLWCGFIFCCLCIRKVEGYHRGEGTRCKSVKYRNKGKE